MKSDPYGNLDNDEKLEVGKIYLCTDMKGEQGYFRASKNGRLFSMWRVTKEGDRCGGYELPHYLVFDEN